MKTFAAKSGAFIFGVTFLMYGIGDVMAGVKIADQVMAMITLFAGLSVSALLTVVLPVTLGLAVLAIGIYLWMNRKTFFPSFFSTKTHSLGYTSKKSEKSAENGSKNVLGAKKEVDQDPTSQNPPQNAVSVDNQDGNKAASSTPPPVIQDPTSSSSSDFVVPVVQGTVVVPGTIFKPYGGIASSCAVEAQLLNDSQQTPPVAPKDGITYDAPPEVTA